MEANIIGFFVGGIGGALAGHILAVAFDIRSRDNPNTPNPMVAIIIGIIAAAGGAILGVDIR
jgi:hypothetical protein